MVDEENPEYRKFGIYPEWEEREKMSAPSRLKYLPTSDAPDRKYPFQRLVLLSPRRRNWVTSERTIGGTDTNLPMSRRFQWSGGSFDRRGPG